MSSDGTKQPQIIAVPQTSDHLGLWVLSLLFLVAILAAMIGIVTIHEGAMAVLLVVGLIILMAASLLILKSYLRARKLDRLGETTEGEVVDLWIRGISDGPDSYYVTYQFGGDVRVSQQVKQWKFQELNIGARITVRYLPDEPTCSRMELN